LQIDTEPEVFGELPLMGWVSKIDMRVQTVSSGEVTRTWEQDIVGGSYLGQGAGVGLDETAAA
jgi:hypothetical protein